MLTVTVTHRYRYVTVTFLYRYRDRYRNSYCYRYLKRYRYDFEKPDIKIKEIYIRIDKFEFLPPSVDFIAKTTSVSVRQ